MSDFERALKATLVYEGGRVDDKDDPGGRTAYGVTQRVYNAWRRSVGKPVRDVWTITYDEIKAIYKRDYWDEVTQGRIWPLNAVLFDAAVNSGPANAEWMLQRAKALNPAHNALKPDAARQLQLAYDVLNVRRGFFRAIPKRRPASAKYLNGWLRRCDQQMQLCATPAQPALGLLDLDTMPAAQEHDFTPRVSDLDIQEVFDD